MIEEVKDWSKTILGIIIFLSCLFGIYFGIIKFIKWVWFLLMKKNF